MRKKGRKNKVYLSEFKMAVEEPRKKQLGLFETIERFELATNPHNAKHKLRSWERIYLEEGATGLKSDEAEAVS